MKKMTRCEALADWMNNMLTRLKNGPKRVIPLGWAVIDGQLKEQYEKGFITKKEYSILHNNGLKSLNFEI